MSKPLCRAVWATALILGAMLRLSGREAPANSEPINLPEFNVVGQRELPPPETWYYTRIAGQEVLSSTSRRRTEDMARDLTQLLHALDLTGTSLLPKQSVPLRIVISGRSDEFLSLAPHVLESGEVDPESATLGGPESPILVLNAAARSLDALAPGDTPNDDADTSESSAPANRAANTIRRLQIGYLRALLAQPRPALPPWFIEGVANVLAWVRITENSVTLGYIEDPNRTGPIGGVDREPGHRTSADVSHESTAVSDTLSYDLDFNAALSHSALLSMAEIFSSDLHTFAGIENAARLTRWQKQCHAFVHWGLFGDFGRNRKKFLAFVHRVRTEPLTEQLFQESFGMNYAEALATLRRHIEMTRVKTAGVKAGSGEKIPLPPPVEVREATPLEVARLKSIVYTAGGQPDKAREELILAYRRGERSPDLVAELGLIELATGNRDRALHHLTLAVKAKTTRLRAYLTLARIQLEDRLARPQGKNGKLSVEQLLGVLEPLLLARTQAPRGPELYLAVAEAWARTDAPIPAQHLALIDEGVALFPDNAALREARTRFAPAPVK